MQDAQFIQALFGHHSLYAVFSCITVNLIKDNSVVKESLVITCCYIVLATISFFIFLSMSALSIHYESLPKSGFWVFLLPNLFICTSSLYVAFEITHDTSHFKRNLASVVSVFGIAMFVMLCIVF